MCLKPKTKVITLANHNPPYLPMNQSELEGTACNRAKRWQTRASKSPLVVFLLLIGRESGARFFNQSQSE